MIALSIRQPWAHHILHNGKDIENRVWSTKHRGRILIHAAKGMTREEYLEASQYRCVLPPMDQLQRGGIVGYVEIVDCVKESNSRWFNGPFGFVLRDPKPIPFFPCRGQLGFFDVQVPGIEG